MAKSIRAIKMNSDTQEIPNSMGPKSELYEAVIPVYIKLRIDHILPASFCKKSIFNTIIKTIITYLG
ncbi:MAG: hypothetical protein ABFR32_12815 [Bacteroidota bacterium]